MLDGLALDRRFKCAGSGRLRGVGWANGLRHGTLPTMANHPLSSGVLLAGLTVALIATGCSGSGTTSVTATIGPAGGTLTLSDGAALTIPAGALASDVEITLERATAPSGAPMPVESHGHAYRLIPHGTTFTTPVSLQLPVSSFSSPLTLYTLADDDDATWERIDGGIIDMTGGRVQIAHFSYVNFGVCDPLTLVCWLCDPASLCDFSQPDAGADAGPAAVCGDGMVTGSEHCDTAITTPGEPYYCPPDNAYCIGLSSDPCMPTWIVGSGGTCDSACVTTFIQDPYDNDGCCVGGDPMVDNDCP